jgi:septal ring factor EnvC (AmiA/AmiB activator)
MINKGVHIFIFFISFFISSLYSQDLSDLKKQKEQIEKKISLTNKLISQAKKKKKNTINDIKLLNNQIKNRNNLINIYDQARIQLKDSIDNLNHVIDDLTSNIESLKKEYEKLILSAYKRKLQYNELNFFLGSKSFNEAYRKFIVLNEYNKYRRKQGEILIESRNELNRKKEQLSELLQKNEELIAELEAEKLRLNNEIKRKNIYLNRFKKQEAKLRREFKKYNKSLSVLNNKIRDVILSYKKKTYASSNFGNMAGKLHWPVDKGVIISKFGIHNHPVLKNIKIKNNGVDIKVFSGSDVKAVFDGVVSRVVVIPGYNQAVIIRHGKYLTVYANLKSVSVNSGQKVKSGQKIGTVYSGEGENSNVLHFEIWKETTKQNPEKWLIL